MTEIDYSQVTGMVTRQKVLVRLMVQGFVLLFSCKVVKCVVSIVTILILGKWKPTILRKEQSKMF